MLKIAICDDEKTFIDKTHSNLKEIFYNINLNVEFSKFSNAAELLNEYKIKHFDVIFLDIDMPIIDGFSVAKSIREISLNTLIIFVTSKDTLVYDSFEYQPFYFICKGSQEKLYSDLSHVAEKILIYFRQKKKIEVLDVAVGKVYIPINHILYIKSEKHYLLYYLKNGDNIPIKERATLELRKNELLQLDFISPHQRYLINMNHIAHFDSLINSITMKNGDQIPISRILRKDVFEKYRIFKRR